MASSSPSPNTSPSSTSPKPAPPPQPSTKTDASSPRSPPPSSAKPPLSPPVRKSTPQSPPSTNAPSPQSPQPLVSPPRSRTPVSAPTSRVAPPTKSSSPPRSMAESPDTSPSSNSSSPPPSPPPKSPSPPPSSPPPEHDDSPPPPDAEAPESSPTPPESPPPSPPPSKKSPPPPKKTPPPSPTPSQSPSPPPPKTPTPPSESPSPPPPSQSPPSPKASPSPPATTFSPPPSTNVKVSPPPPSSPSTNSTSTHSSEASSSGGNEGVHTGVMVAIGIVLGLLFLLVVGLAFAFLRRRKKRRSRSNGGHIMPTSRNDSPHSDSGLLKGGPSASRYVSTSGSELVNSPSQKGILGSSRVGFTYEELFDATDGFSKPNLLGEGGFGSVYKGYLVDGKEVAVKQLKIGGGQGEREFKAEVEIISRIHHRHLVSLAGYCIWESRRLLVYEYVPNNNLHFHLHGEGRPVMDWATRLKIAAGSARGIAYLHEDCHPRVIHRDIKSSNILLDNNFEAKVSDFGLAKLAEDANTHISTRVVGTFGYMAPEYASSGKLTEKSDVYSFGVVLLELITGRKPVDKDESLVEWARPLLYKALETEDFEGVADPKLEKNYIKSEMLQVVEVAAACVRHSAIKRPRMGQVVRALESMIASDITNGVPVGNSEIYSAPVQSAEIRWFQRVAFGNQDFSTDFLDETGSFDRSNSSANKVKGGIV